MQTKRLLAAALALAVALPTAASLARGPAGPGAEGHPHERMHAPARHHGGGHGFAPGGGLLGVGPGAADHVEGRIAFLRAELAISEGQAAAWDAFAEAMRANAKRVTAPPAPAEGALGRLESAEQRLSERLEGVRATRVALAALQPQLDEAQKKTLDALLSPPPARGPRR